MTCVLMTSTRSASGCRGAGTASLSSWCIRGRRRWAGGRDCRRGSPTTTSWPTSRQVAAAVAGAARGWLTWIQQTSSTSILLSVPVEVHADAAELVGVDLLARRGFAEGEVSVQDAGAQRAAGLLDLRAGQRALDACAAPGGKAAHILETADVALEALDVDAARSAGVTRDLARLGLAASVRTAHCAAPESWWDGRPFDRILADVPCRRFRSREGAIPT